MANNEIPLEPEEQHDKWLYGVTFEDRVLAHLAANDKDHKKIWEYLLNGMSTSVKETKILTRWICGAVALLYVSAMGLLGWLIQEKLSDTEKHYPYNIVEIEKGESNHEETHE